MIWDDEHRIGIAAGVDAEILEGLKMNFTGECTEVGMYLAMSRQADREGFPEVAEAYKKIAFEEAEHAAKFAELLGEVVFPSTKKNLELRVDAEYGACQGKLEVFIDVFEGLVINFPLNFRNVQPRKSNPSSICVIIVFSSDKVNPRVLRNWLTRFLTSSAISFVFAVMIKSSAYLTKFTLFLAR